MQPLQAPRHRLFNAVQSGLLLAAMAAIASSLGWIVAGPAGAAWALLLSAALVFVNPHLSPQLVLRLYRASPLPRHAAPELHAAVEQLASRAGLPAAPGLYRVPSAMVNAFAVGSPRRSAIALTDAILGALTPRELLGVLAHEMNHIRNNDLWVMGLADLFSRVTHALSTLGQVLLLLNLPLIVLSDYHVSWLAIAALIFAPLINVLIQLALSRTREYDADLGAAELTGDPEALASALRKMEQFRGKVLEQILAPGRRVPDPSLLRTHPHTEDRIRRLRELAPSQRARQPLPEARLPAGMRAADHGRPRWHVTGIWR